MGEAWESGTREHSMGEAWESGTREHSMGEAWESGMREHSMGEAWESRSSLQVRLLPSSSCHTPVNVRRERVDTGPQPRCTGGRQAGAHTATHVLASGGVWAGRVVSTRPAGYPHP
jgi:hypothetical protein